MQLPTTETLKEALEIRTQIDELEGKLTSIFGAPRQAMFTARSPQPDARHKAKKPMSAEHRAALSANAKKRWATARKAGRSKL